MRRITVVTPTLERRAAVLGCVGSLLSQTRPPDELIVVDNGSRDGTPEALAAAFGGRARVLFEPRRGVSHARNRGIEAACGDVVAFIDDDARAEPDWLERLEACLEESGALGAGGPAVPDWEVPPPPWLASSPKALAAVGAFSLGERRRRLEPREFLMGLNCAFRREVFDSGLRFRSLRAGRPGFGMEDVDFTARAARLGPVFYEPSARVRHRVPRRKASLSHLAARSFDDGRKMVEAVRSPRPRWRRGLRPVDAWTSAFTLAGWTWQRLSGP